MTTNTVIGPDDDQPRDAAEVYDLEEQRRRRGRPVAGDEPADGEPIEGRIVAHQGTNIEPADDPDEIDEDDDDDLPLIPFRAITRTLVRHPAYVAAGTRTVARRQWEARTTVRHERMMRAAEAQGDNTAALEWEQRASAFRKERHERRMAMLAAPVHAARAVVFGGLTGFGLLLLLGIALAVANKRPSEVTGPLMAAAEVIRFLVHLVAILWQPAAGLALLAALVALWNTGRTRGELPTWLMPEGYEDSEGEPITPSLVVVALRDLGIPKLTAAIKEMGDAGAGMLSAIRIAGCGVEVDVALPSGVNTVQVQNKRRTLAENLGRHEHELFITIPPTPRTVRLWIADSGALDEPIGPSPLQIDPQISANYKSGRAPWGQDLRGDAALISLFQRHLLITGLSNQGKTAALRALALWLVLHVIVEFRIADLKGVGDWRMFNCLATVLIEGPTDEHAIEATLMLEDGVEEMERRLMAPEGSTFRPLILIVDEAQNAFMNPAIGPDKRPYGGSKNTSRYFMAARKLQNQGRAVDVLLWQGTQDPTNTNLPKLVREGAHIRAALALGTEEQARMALGDKAINAGAAPHKLRTGVDKGTVVVAGDGVQLAPGQSSITIRTHYIDTDTATEIADRAKALRKRTSTRAAATAQQPPRDLLDDLIEVIGSGTEPVWCNDTPALLRDLAPDWEPYRELSGVALREQLTLLGIKVATTGNRPRFDPAAVHAAQLRRTSG